MARQSSRSEMSLNDLNHWSKGTLTLAMVNAYGFQLNKSLSIVPFFTLKLPISEYFMTVKSVFDIKCFKDVKFWVEQSVYIIIYRNPKTFFKISSPPPPPPPPHVPAKAFAYICVTIFYTLYGSGLLAQEGERCSAARKPRA